MVHPRYTSDLATGFLGVVLTLLWLSVVPLPLALLVFDASRVTGALVIHVLAAVALAIPALGWLRETGGHARLLLAAAGVAALSAQLVRAAGP